MTFKSDRQRKAVMAKLNGVNMARIRVVKTTSKADIARFRRESDRLNRIFTSEKFKRLPKKDKDRFKKAKSEIKRIKTLSALKDWARRHSLKLSATVGSIIATPYLIQVAQSSGKPVSDLLLATYFVALASTALADEFKVLTGQYKK